MRPRAPRTGVTLSAAREADENPNAADWALSLSAAPYLWGEMMDHFEGVIPDERWKNDLLREVRKQTEFLETLIRLLDQRGTESLENVAARTMKNPGRRKRAVNAK